MNTKIFHFSGFGNYSIGFGWDNGISVNVQQDVVFTEEEYNNTMSDIEEGHDAYIPVPKDVSVGEFNYYMNDYAGSRNVWGWVCAESYEQACEIVEQWAQKA